MNALAQKAELDILYTHRGVSEVYIMILDEVYNILYTHRAVSM